MKALRRILTNESVAQDLKSCATLFLVYLIQIYQGKLAKQLSTNKK